jgi:putative peptidoglycan lipid II flippase
MEPTAVPPPGRLASLVVGAAAALSRLLGFARDVGLAVLFGAGPVGDALLIALRLPNLVRRVLGEGGLHTAFVPLMLGEHAREGEQAARQFAGQVMVSLALLFGLLAVVVQCLAVPLVLLLGAPAQTADLAAQALCCLFRWWRAAVWPPWPQPFWPPDKSSRWPHGRAYWSIWCWCWRSSG